MTETTERPTTLDPSREDASPRDVVSILFRRLLGMTVIFTVGMVVALVWILVVRNDVYETTAKILVRIGHEQTPSVTVMDRQTPIVGYRYQDVATEVQILNSTDVIARVVDRLGLEAGPEPERPKRWLAALVFDLRRLQARVREWTNEALVRVGMRERLSPREGAIDALQRGLLVGSSQESNVVVAKLRLPHRAGAAAVLDAILDEYLTARMGFFQENEALALLRANMNRTLAELREAEAEKRRLESRSNIVDMDIQKELLLRQQEDLSLQLKQGVSELEGLEAKLAALRKDGPDGAVDFAGLGSFPQGSFASELMVDLAQLQKERIGIESAAGGRDQRRVDENRHRFRETAALLESNVESLIEERRKRAATQREALEGVRGQLASLHSGETAWRDLQRRASLLEADYRFYRREVEEASASSSMKSELVSNVKVIQHPMDPLQPAGTRKLYLVAIAALLCLFAAVAWAGAAEFLDHRIHSTSQLARALGAQVVGAVPGLSRRELARHLESEGTPPPGSEGAFAAPAAFVARHRRRQGTRHLLLASARAGEGTTTCVLGIARELRASYGLRVLAVELNARSGGFQRALGLVDPPPRYLRDEPLGPEAVGPGPGGFSMLSIQGTEEGREAARDSAQLLSRALASLDDAFDVVLVDAPPVLERPEALAAVPSLAGALLVVEAGRTRSEVLERIRSLFDLEGVRLLGSVLTKQRHAIPGWAYRLLFP